MQRSEPIQSASVTGKPTRQRSSPAAKAASVLLILSATVVTWWLIGFDVVGVFGGEMAPDPDHYESVMRPPPIGPVAEQVIGVAATVVLLASIVILIVNARRRRFDPLWLPALTGLAITGVATGLFERAATVPIIENGMGRGQALLFFAFAVVVLVPASLLWIVYVIFSTIPDTSLQQNGAC